MNRAYFFLFMSFLGLISCGKKQGDNIDDFAIEIDLSSPQTKSVDDLITSVDFIPVISQDIFGIVTHIKANDSRIILCDNEASQKIWIVDKTSGNHLSIIDRSGGGPSEYEIIDHISLYEDSIFILSPRKILAYDLEGNFLLERLHNVYPSCFYYSGISFWFNGVNNQILRNDQSNYNLIQEGKNLDVIGKYLPFQEKHMKNYYELNDPFQEFDGIVTFIKSMDMNIYEIRDEKLNTRYRLNFGQQISDSDFESVNSKGLEFVNYLSASNKVWTLDNFLETKSHLIISFRMGNEPQVYLYDKKKKETYSISNTNSDFWLKWLLINPITYDGNYVYGVMESGDFEAFSEYMNDENIHREVFKGIADTLTIQSNPIILKIDFD